MAVQRSLVRVTRSCIDGSAHAALTARIRKWKGGSISPSHGRSSAKSRKTGVRLPVPCTCVTYTKTPPGPEGSAQSVLFLTGQSGGLSRPVGLGVS